MTLRRACLLILGIAAFSLGLMPWLRFLYGDRCSNRGGMLLNEICVGAEPDVPGLWSADLEFQLAVLVPPAIGAAIVSWLASRCWPAPPSEKPREM